MSTQQCDPKYLIWSQPVVEKITNHDAVIRMQHALQQTADEVFASYNGRVVPENVDFYVIFPDGRVIEPESKVTAAVCIELYGSLRDAMEVHTPIGSGGRGSKFESCSYSLYKIDPTSRLRGDDRGKNLRFYVFLNKNGRLGIVYANEDTEEIVFFFIREHSLTYSVGHYCSWCGDDSGKKKKYCSRCLKSKYCSKECQIAHAQSGHVNCKGLNAFRDV
jgi:hypothetical protein